MISSEKSTENEENTGKYNRREFGYESFCRSFTLPDNSDGEKINASYRDGILNIEIPKSKEDVKLKRTVKIS